MIRAMMIEDYEGVYKLWKQIKGFGIRSIDDSREGLERFLRRNPTTSIVAEEEGEIVGSILCGHDGRRGCFYHVCVAEEHRMKGIGTQMAKLSLIHIYSKGKWMSGKFDCLDDAVRSPGSWDEPFAE